MNKIGKIAYRTIDKISPSQFYSMKNCAYKSLLAEAYGKKPLLPVSPNAYFGSVLHKILELISKGAIGEEAEFNKLFDEHLKLEEDNLIQQGYQFFVPLQKNVKDFGMKKILLKKHLRNLAEKRPVPQGVKFYSEKWFESNDKLISGKMDLVIEGGQEIEIIDFKTGAITQDVLDDAGEIFSEIKDEYKDQLKLYAYLYFENTGKFPTLLSLIDLAKQKFTVVFSQSDCNALALEAKGLLEATNKSISNGLFEARPSVANCKYCLYRPACSFFLEYLTTDYSFNDVSGLVRDVVKYQNGNVSVFLENGDKKFTITSFPSEKYEELNSCRHKPIGAFNLRKEATDFVYAATKTTKIYE